MPFVTIQWGEDPRDQSVSLYEFDTFAEREAFLKGVNECHGWGAWDALDWDEVAQDGSLVGATDAPIVDNNNTQENST